MMNIKNVTFIVEGMSCHHCEMGVEKNIKKLDGIISVSASADCGEVNVEYDGHSVNENMLKEAIEDRGFVVLDVKI